MNPPRSIPFRRLTAVALSLVVLMTSATIAFSAETTDPVRATVQVRCGNSAGSGTAIGPQVVLSCAHIADGDSAHTAFVIEKHWADGTRRYRGELLAIHADLDLALIAVPDADFDHVRLVDGDPSTPQAATFLGHAGARPEILAFRGYISRGYSTNFDIVAGHDSIEGQSGGGVFDANGRLLGVIHGRPNATVSSRGGGIFTPMRHIRKWMATDCRGPRCQPYLPRSLQGRSLQPSPQIRNYGQVIPPPRRDPPQATPQNPAPANNDLATVIARLDELSQRIDRLKQQPGPQGPPGPQGERGPAGPEATFDEARLAATIEARMGLIIDQRVEQAVASRVPHFFSIVPRQPKGN